MGWEEDRYLILSMADMVRMPEFHEILQNYPDQDCQLIEVDEHKAQLLRDNGHNIIIRGGKEYWERKGIPLEAVKELFVKHLDANPKKPVVVDFVTHRTIDRQIVTCDRFWTFHKDAKYIDQELFDELNKMQKTSILGDYN